MNISFTKLGEEQCELCEEYTYHRCQRKQDSNKQESGNKNCEKCERIKIHLERGKKSQESYKADSRKNARNAETCFTIDMQKVLMFRHLPGMKTAQFTRRIIIINQSIAPFGEFKNKRQHKAKGYFWHEGIQGRKDENLASVVWKFLLESEHRDCKNIKIWCDSCTGQNKNWTLYSSIVQRLSVSQILVEAITLKHFEKGDIFMAADSPQ